MHISNLLCAYIILLVDFCNKIFLYKITKIENHLTAKWARCLPLINNIASYINSYIQINYLVRDEIHVGLH